MKHADYFLRIVIQSTPPPYTSTTKAKVELRAGPTFFVDEENARRRLGDAVLNVGKRLFAVFINIYFFPFYFFFFFGGPCLLDCVIGKLVSVVLRCKRLFVARGSSL